VLSFLSQLEVSAVVAPLVAPALLVTLHWSASVIPPAEAKLRLPEPSVFKNVLLVIDCGKVKVYDCPAE